MDNRKLPPSTKRVRRVLHWDDLGFAAVMTAEPLDNAPNDPPYHVDLCLYAVTGWDDHECKIPVFATPDRCVGLDEIDEAEPEMTGMIRSDGCSNLHFMPYEAHCLHFCGKHAATNFGVVLGRLYDMAAEMMPNHKSVTDH